MHLLNLSILTNSFPNHWKIAKVTPLHKGGARNDINNYRPISVLPILSKILEKHVFLRDNNLLYELQSAFRSGQSTETAFIRLTDQILKNMDNDEVTSLVFRDFRKASDVIDHELLLKKLSIYGATPSSVAWFKSYLSERKQFISLGKTTSKQLTVKQGVPQGSILGPVLNRVLRMQKRAARIILESQRTSRTATLFNNLSWIPFYNETYIKRCELAFKRINGSQLPDY